MNLTEILEHDSAKCLTLAYAIISTSICHFDILKDVMEKADELMSDQDYKMFLSSLRDLDALLKDIIRQTKRSQKRKKGGNAPADNEESPEEQSEGA